MKKIILSLTGVLAATAFAPEASAVPAFARQTGMACNACHQQHFPVLNKFGQAFKASGFTMMGSQGKVEGEHLSLPDTLNAAVLLKARYQKENGTDVTGSVHPETNNSGAWNLPDEMSLFFGGRIADANDLKIGFISENSFTGNGAGGMLTGLKIPAVYDLGSAKATVVVFATDGQGAAYGYDLSSTGMVRGIRWAEHGTDISAMNYTGMLTAASGLAFAVQNDMGYAALTRWSPTLGLGQGNKLTSNFLRIAATPTVADWAMQIGVGIVSGENSDGVDTPAAPATFLADGVTVLTAATPYTPATLVDTKATAVDFQAHGQIGGLDAGIYGTYAKVPKATATKGNLFAGTAVADKKAFTVGADVSVIPSTLHIGAAYRSANDGGSATAADGKDNSITLTAIYDLTMNVALHLNHSMRSGSSYDAGGLHDATTVAADGSRGAKSLTTFLLEAAW